MKIFKIQLILYKRDVIWKIHFINNKLRNIIKNWYKYSIKGKDWMYKYHQVEIFMKKNREN